MIDIKIKYQASIFADVRQITPSSENISILIELFRDKELIPNIIQEIGSSDKGIEPRIMLSNLKNEWRVTFGSTRINVEKYIMDAKGDNLGNLVDFCTEASDIFAKIFERFKIKSNRLALVATYLLEEMAPAALIAAYSKFFNQISFYAENVPYEWNWRSVSKVPFDFSGLNETLNVITSINRIRVEIALPDRVIPLDRIQLMLDLNTTQESTESRFNTVFVNDFYKQILSVHDVLLKQVEDKLNE